MTYTFRIFFFTVTLLTMCLGMAFSQDFFCRPWLQIPDRETFGESFSIKIENGEIFIRGISSPISYAKLIYSHPLYDVFMAGSGEIITAGVIEPNVKLNIFFPNEDIFYFVKTSCRGM